MSPLIEMTDPLVFDRAIILIDVRAGADAHQKYLAGHLPNAIFASLDDDLASHPANPAYGGRHPLPALEVFAATLTRWGITPDSHVIVYDDKAAAMGAARLWWMLRAIGHKQVQVINGGLKSAIDKGIDLSTDDYQPKQATSYPVPPAYKGVVEIDEVGAAAKSSNRIVIDVRENARYLGRTEPIDLIAGHIPGAANLFYAGNLGEDGKYLAPEELAAIYKHVIGDIKQEDVIVHCGSGITACHTLLGMASAGLTEPKLYVGSWSEWSRRGLPIATEGKNE
jgi:thiosulfate/3-mercaptopyruvate sulfurtransferase